MREIDIAERHCWSACTGRRRRQYFRSFVDYVESPGRLFVSGRRTLSLEDRDRERRNRPRDIRHTFSRRSFAREGMASACWARRIRGSLSAYVVWRSAEARRLGPGTNPRSQNLAYG